MHYYLLLFVSYILYIIFPLSLDGSCNTHSFFSPRSQGVHTYHELMRWHQYGNMFIDQQYTIPAVQLLYASSFSSHHIAQYFFNTDTVCFSGNEVPHRGNNDILADYFGLPLDYCSTVQIKPHAYATTITVDWYKSFDEYIHGLYARVYTPIVHTRWHIHLKEQTHNKGNQPYPAGYMAYKAIPRPLLYETVTEAFTGKKEIGDIQPLKYGKIDGPRTDTGLAEIKIVLGYNPIIHDQYHVGFNAQLSIPTGNRSRSEYLFEPIYGNGHHWECGIGFSGHAILWNSSDELSAFIIYADLALNHVWRSRQRRSFDFKHNGALSRYMLIQEIGSPVVAGLTLNTLQATNQYHGKLMPAINITTLDTDISITVVIDAILKCSYQYNNLDITVGYNLWARTAEQCHKRDTFPNNCFAIKGDAQLYGFIELEDNQFVALNATESNATIHKGQGLGNIAKIDTSVINSFANSNVDNAALIEFMGNGLVVDDTAAVFVSINGSNQAMTLTNKDIDNKSGLAPAALAHTLFISGNYMWDRQHTITPFVGKGLSVEWCQSVKKTHALFSNWSIWIKGGICW